MKRVVPVAASLLLLAWLTTGCETPPAKPTAVEPPPTVAEAPKPAEPPKPRFSPPVIAAREFSETFHGVTVRDPYRHLENLNDPDIQAWMKSQSAFTKSTLARIPAREKLTKRISELSEASVAVNNVQWEGNLVFYRKQNPGDRTAKLYVREGLSGNERMLVDPDQLAGKSPATIDYYEASPDGRHAAVGISVAGSEDSVLRIVETASGRDLGVAITQVQPGEALHWHPDGRSLFYTRQMHQPSDRSRMWLGTRTFRHVLGTPQDTDVPLIGHGMPNSAGLAETDIPEVRVASGSNTAVAVISHGDARHKSIYATSLSSLGPNSIWRKIASAADLVTAVDQFADDLFMLTTKGAPRGRLMVTSASRGTFDNARQAVAQGEYVMSAFAIAANAIYLRELSGGVDILNRVSINKSAITGQRQFVRLPSDLAVNEMISDPKRPGVLLRLQSYTESPQYKLLNIRGELESTPLLPKSNVDFSKIEEVRLYAVAKDGTRIPLSLRYRTGITLNKANPTMMTSYGSYGIPLRPLFDPANLAWLERGGVLATCHVRGGGEYGEEWHNAGKMKNKENTVTDTIACAEFLIARGFTQPARLAVTGRSAGGIPVGNALVRRPDLFAAAIPGVGVLDTLRMEFTPNGPPNTLEFGTVKKADDFKFLQNISAYHQIKDGTAYPGVMLVHGANDPRVEPWFSTKFAARMQVAQAGTRPVLLRMDYEGGHRASTRAARNAELADIYTFALWQMGDPEFQPK